MYNMHLRLRHELLDCLVDTCLVHTELSGVHRFDHSAEGDSLPYLLCFEPDTSVEADRSLEGDMRSKRW